MAKSKNEVKEQKKHKEKPKKKTNRDIHKKDIVKTSKKESKTLDRKWNENYHKPTKIKYKTGKITLQEESVIVDALCSFALENEYSEEDIINLILTKQSKSSQKTWTKIAECLPERSVQSIHNFCHRKFHPYNYKGKWTVKEEKDLLSLVKEHGQKWELIAGKMERTAANCRDKYKEVKNKFKGGNKENEEEGEFSVGKRLRLIKEINNTIQESKRKILKFNYKFKNDVEERHGDVFFLDKENGVFYIDKALKNYESKTVLKNILRKIINIDNLEKLSEEKAQISWTEIAEKLEFYGKDGCRNEYRKILNLLEINTLSSYKKNKKMIDKIKENGFENKDDIIWAFIKNGRTEEENKDALNRLLLTYDPLKVMDFSKALDVISERLDEYFNKNETGTDEEFEEEMEKLKGNDIVKIYRKYRKKYGVMKN